MADADYAVELLPDDGARLRAAAARFGPELVQQVTTELRAEATATVQTIRRRLLSGPAHVDVGLRRGLANGIDVNVSSRPGDASVQLRATGRALPADKQALVAAFDRPSFRHPVYGHRTVEVTQSGRPYFGSVIAPREHEFERAVERGADVAAHRFEELIK